MADSTTFSNDAAHHHTWFVLGVLVFAHAVFNALFNGFSGPQTYQRYLVIGVTLSQPVLFATWIAIGPPPATVRLPITIVAFAAIILAGAISSVVWLSPDYLLVGAALFAVTTLVMFIVARLTGWRICKASHGADTGMPHDQFSLKYLLAVTAIFAALLGVGRALGSRVLWSQSEPWQNVIAVLLMLMSFISLAMIPALFVPLVVLSSRPRFRVLVAIPFLWVGVTWLAVETIVAMKGVPRWEAVWTIALGQVGAAASGMLSAFVLRVAGFRLFTHRSTLPQSMAPSR